MACSVLHTYDQIKSMVKKQTQEDRGRHLVIMNLGHQFDNACTAKDELRKAYEECKDIPLEQRALIEIFLKIESKLEYEMQNALLTVLMALQEAHDEEAFLEEQMLTLMHRFAGRFTNHRPEINRLMTLPDHPLIEYGRYALGCMTGADMKKATYLKMARDELPRSMEEKHQLIKNYKEI
ncbi:hypothetical protein Tco_0289728 [Tanacetum coccineum]